MQEPLSLPAKLPMLLLQGAEGIAVGMATKIMPHNFCELLEAQIKILKEEPFEIYPDFPQGGLVDISGYNQGNGRIKCRARLEEKNDKTILIKEIPYATTTQSLMESIEKAARLGKIKIQSINDYTAEEVEIEIKLARGVYAKDTVRALYAFTDCEISLSPNLTVIQDNQPVNISVNDVLTFNTAKLVGDLQTELEIELDRLREKLHAHLLEQIFIEERLYKQIEECKSYKLVKETIVQALEPFADQLLRAVTKEDIERLLEIRIKRISRYDINKKRKDIKEIKTKSRKVEKYLKDMVGYTINYLEDLLKKYGTEYPRRTEIRSFREVVVRKVALSNLLVGYDPESGFLGHQVKSEQNFSCSEYDRMLLIFKNGLYKIINVVDKLFVGPDLLWVNKMEKKLVFNIIYRDGRENLSYIKRFNAPKYILNKEYQLFPEHKKSFIQFLTTEPDGQIRVYFAPSKRAKKNYADLAWNDFLLKGVSAKGKRISTRVVRRVADWTGKKTDKPQAPTLFDLKK
jgi:topoisomerase-4 subunit A